MRATTTRAGRPAKQPTTINTSVREGRFIKRMRLYSGNSADYIATEVGINRSTLANYESGFKRIPDYRIDALARALNIDPWEIRVAQEALVAA